ncbi:DoxX family protein [Dietzia timorensis]|uniref:DoxX family protein n=2 Tax=Dietzia timorensis TaxID=499555 RepID=A0A173LP94_9ACTN|nr:DoxX family protein [Dietzia timorensis]ANI93458.1 Hypothetical protein BJL86_2698 [Dietzia timorensis]
MTALTLAHTAVLGAAFGGAGYAKVSQQDAMVDAAKHLGYSNDEFTLIGTAELAGVAGLVVGAKFPLVGAASSAALATTMGLAVSEHLRAGDEAKVYAAPAVLGVLSATATLSFLAAARKKRKEKKEAKQAKKAAKKS